MENPAIVADVQSRFFRPLTDTEETVVTTRLGDAWADLQSAVKDLVERLETEGSESSSSSSSSSSDDPLLTQTKRVLAQAVIRLLLNPFGRKQESRGIDDGQRSWTLAESLSGGELYFTDDELDSLRSEDSTDYRGKAFSVTPWFNACESSSSSSSS